jgi:putative addiction module component (TIGR02574 family)
MRQGKNMNASVVSLFRRAADLAEADRAALAGLLLESLDHPPAPGVEAAWAEEIERRVKEVEDGRVKTIPWEEVKSRLLATERGRKKR